MARITLALGALALPFAAHAHHDAGLPHPHLDALTAAPIVALTAIVALCALRHFRR